MTELTQRQQQLLTYILEAYVDDAEPVSSRFVVDQHGLEWSPATIRNEMAALEHAGFITHPHTSAGRVPTEAGWRHYLAAADTEKALSAAEHTVLKKAAAHTEDHIQRTKEIAKAIAELSAQTVIV